MRYFDFLKEIREISVAHKLVNEYGEGDIYEYLNSGEHKYPCVFLTVTNLSTTFDGTAINFTLFYNDRLLENQSNKTAIQSTGIDVIKQLLSKFESKHPEFEIDNVNYQPFTEKFADMCAGVFCNVILENGVDTLEGYNDCEVGDFELKTIYLTANGIYDVIGYDKAVVAVEIPLTNITVTENGVYKADEGGYNEVVVAVPINELNDITITENGVYKADEGGYGEVVVNVAVGSNKIKVNKVEVENNCIVDGTWTGFDVFDKTTLTTLTNMFSDCSDLVTLNADGWVTNNVKSISGMFNYCVNLKSLNVSNWDISNVTSISNIFRSCSSLESLDLSGWDVGKVTNMYSMFNGCGDLNTVGDLSNWDVSNVTDMSRMFYECENLQSLNLSGWNTSEIINMDYMFYNCKSLQSLDLSGWVANEYLDDFFMFRNAYNLKTLVGGKNIDEVISNNISVLKGIKSQIMVNDTQLDRASLRALINGLTDLTGSSSSSSLFTIGSTLKAKLTPEDIAIVTAKNWTIT